MTYQVVWAFKTNDLLNCTTTIMSNDLPVRPSEWKIPPLYEQGNDSRCLQSQATTLEVQAREMPCSTLPVCGAAAAGIGRPWGMRCWLLQQGWGCCMRRAACSGWTVCLWCWRCLRCPCIRALRLIHLHLQTITRPSSIHLTMGQTHRNQVKQ